MMSLPPQKASSVQAGLGDLPKCCIERSNPESFLLGCGGRKRAGEQVLGWWVPLQLLNTDASPTNLMVRRKGKDHHVASPGSRCFGDRIVYEVRGGFGIWSPLAVLPTWECLGIEDTQGRICLSVLWSPSLLQRMVFLQSKHRIHHSA